MTDIPPPRYRIVERKGRIIVTDTWQDGRPAPTSSPMPQHSDARRRSLPPFLAQLRTRLVMLACLGATDEAGHPILTTHIHFDEKGPRGIALSDAGAKRLGNLLLGVTGIVVALLVGFVFTPFAAIVAVGGIGLGFTSANTTARPAITRWLDTLGSDRPR